MIVTAVDLNGTLHDLDRYRMSDIKWKIIKDYENYSISDTGYIKNNKTNRILKSCLRNGYNSVTLCKNNTKKTVNIHTIVAEHFLEKPKTKCVVNHKDENKTNNHISNLEYISYKENTIYSMTCNRSKNEKPYDLKNFKLIPNYSKYMVSSNADIYSSYTKRLCCITVLPNGYHKIKLKDDKDNYKDMYVHVIVAMAYLNYVPAKNTMINHIDGIKGNNNINNLEIVTPKENAIHSVKINNHRIYRKSVYYIDTNGNHIKYESAKKAYLETGIDNSSILKSCRSNNRTAGNIKWYFTSSS